MGYTDLIRLNEYSRTFFEFFSIQVEFEPPDLQLKERFNLFLVATQLWLNGLIIYTMRLLLEFNGVFLFSMHVEFFGAVRAFVN